jgi:hypothetical protein
MQPQPGRDPLVEDELRVLMPAVRQRHDKDVGHAQALVAGVDELAGGAEVHLRLLPGPDMHPHRHVRSPGPQLGDEPAHRCVAAAVAVVGAQPVVDRHRLHASVQQVFDH